MKYENILRNFFKQRKRKKMTSGVRHKTEKNTYNYSLILHALMIHLLKKYRSAALWVSAKFPFTVTCFLCSNSLFFLIPRVQLGK